jgi:RimJ/RimL family protein N-acetyltransferase
MKYKTSEGLFRIDCEDIYLQEFSIGDAIDISRISNEPEIVNFLPDWKSTKEQRLMYAISSEYQGKGYATRASKGLINYLFTNTNGEIINAVALMDNVSKNKVIEKCGFTEKLWPAPRYGQA